VLSIGVAALLVASSASAKTKPVKTSPKVTLFNETGAPVTVTWFNHCTVADGQCKFMGGSRDSTYPTGGMFSENTPPVQLPAGAKKSYWITKGPEWLCTNARGPSEDHPPLVESRERDYAFGVSSPGAHGEFKCLDVADDSAGICEVELLIQRDGDRLYCLRRGAPDTGPPPPETAESGWVDKADRWHLWVLGALFLFIAWLLRERIFASINREIDRFS
jgi:hypothetical protein